MTDFYPTANIIADSINECGDRLTTFVLTYHRMIHSEFMTHRMFSRNASSSRAIPVEKMIRKVIADNVCPLHWGVNQKGMVADSEINEMRQEEARSIWESARDNAIAHADALASIGVHKQVVNRLLEPFSTITVICSGTEYQNFFNQRCHPDAQPEIQALAMAMRQAYIKSEPFEIHVGALHIPFINFEDVSIIKEKYSTANEIDAEFIKIAVGRCARVSYLNHDGDRSIDDDIKLHDRLLASKPSHLSPFEHIAIALPSSEKKANFTGWQSYRNQLENAV